MGDFLSNLDPDVIAVVFGALFTFWRHTKSASQEGNVKETLKSALRRVVLHLVYETDARAKARRLLNEAADAKLAELGIARKSVNLIVHALIEAAMVELEERLLAHEATVREMDKALRQLDAGAQRVGDATDTTKTNPRIPRLDLDIEIREPAHDDERGNPDPSQEPTR